MSLPLMSHEEVYSILKEAGHSNLKSLEIATRYERGELLAVTWVHGWKAILLEQDLRRTTDSTTEVAL